MWPPKGSKTHTTDWASVPTRDGHYTYRPEGPSWIHLTTRAGDVRPLCLHPKQCLCCGFRQSTSSRSFLRSSCPSSERASSEGLWSISSWAFSWLLRWRLPASDACRDPAASRAYADTRGEDLVVRSKDKSRQSQTEITTFVPRFQEEMFSAEGRAVVGAPLERLDPNSLPPGLGTGRTIRIPAQRREFCCAGGAGASRSHDRVARWSHRCQARGSGDPGRRAVSPERP